MTKSCASLLLSLALLPQISYGMGMKPVDPVDVEVAQYKPKAGDTSAAEKCRQLSERAALLGIRTLVIGFEGLASYDSSGTTEAYKAQWNRQQNKTPSWPSASSGGYVLHGLLIPFMKQSRAFETLVFPHDSVNESSGGAAEACAVAWMRDSRYKNRRLVVTGHSYGGHAANQLASLLKSRDVRIDWMISIDPRTRGYVGSLGRTTNADRWENYYQTNTPFLNGYTVPGADLNRNLSSTGVGHTQMPRAAAVQEAFAQALRD